MKGASRWCKERLSWIRRNALLKWRRAFPSFYPFVIMTLVPMFLSLNNMSLNQYVFMSFCLKNYVPLSEKPVLLSHLVYIYPPTQHRFC